MKKQPTFIDLFAGAGGFGLGFQMGGFNPLLSIELDSFACLTLKRNNKHAILNANIMDFNTESKIDTVMNMKKPDVIIGGPPCQGFSVAASNRAILSDSRNNLFKNYLFWVSILKPKVFVIENVPGILTKKYSNKCTFFDTIESESKKLGYNLCVWRLNAADYGVPQNRNRVFIVGCLENIDSLAPPTPTHFKVDSDAMPKHVTVGDSILDLPFIKARQGTECMAYGDILPNNDYQKWARTNSKFVFNHVAMNHTERLIERYQSIQEGIHEFPDNIKVRKRSGNGEFSGVKFNQNYRHLTPNSVSYTIPASFYSSFIHPTIPRNITTREAARLQSFPDYYKFEGSRTLVSNNLLKKNGKEHLIGLSQYNQVGNAVPPLLSKAIAKKIKELLC